MATLTIRNLDESIKRRLRVRAAEHGVSMEEEARAILRASLTEVSERGRPAAAGTPQAKWHLDMTLEELLAFGRKPERPFDLKKLSDEMWDESL